MSRCFKKNYLYIRKKKLDWFSSTAHTKGKLSLSSGRIWELISELILKGQACLVTLLMIL